MTRYFGKAETPMRRWIYGAACPVGNEAAYVARFEAHNEQVMDYFKKRPSDLFVFPLTTNPSWETLCAFLGKPIPEGIKFPRLNKNDKISR